MLEIERTFLVKVLPKNLKKYKFDKIKQGYISGLPAPLRIRQIGDRYELTKKTSVGGDVTVNEEINLLLTSGEFAKLWPLTIASLEKTRYYIPLDQGLTAELDIFSGRLSGYMVVEVEFRTDTEKKKFVPPSWFGADISLEDISSSRKLTAMTIKEVRTVLERL